MQHGACIPMLRRVVKCYGTDWPQYLLTPLGNGSVRIQAIEQCNMKTLDELWGLVSTGVLKELL